MKSRRVLFIKVRTNVKYVKEIGSAMEIKLFDALLISSWLRRNVKIAVKVILAMEARMFIYCYRIARLFQRFI